MRVVTHWPALIPAIRRAGHEPVLVDACGVCKGTGRVRAIRDFKRPDDDPVNSLPCPGCDGRGHLG